jgi:hypothetical protein
MGGGMVVVGSAKQVGDLVRADLMVVVYVVVAVVDWYLGPSYRWWAREVQVYVCK